MIERIVTISELGARADCVEVMPSGVCCKTTRPTSCRHLLPPMFLVVALLVIVVVFVTTMPT